jgi:nucleoside-diphosphate-sugar epimerase
VRILVTGGAGYLGSQLCDTLHDRGHEVVALDSLLHGGEALLGQFRHRTFQFIKADIRDTHAVRDALRRVDGVVHLAAIVGDPACRRDPNLAREVNLEASLRLFAEAREAGVERFVFASTCSNYGRMPDPETYITEESQLAPLSVYAETKVAVERAILSEPKGSRPAPIQLRFATLYGISPRPRFDLTVNEFSAELLTKRHLEVYGERFWRPYVHVADAAEATRLALEAPLESVEGQVFNVGDTRENYTKADLVQLIRERIDGEVTIDRVEVAEDPRDYRVSFDKIRDVLGFSVSRTVPDGIDEVLEVVRAGVVADHTDPRYRN